MARPIRTMYSDQLTQPVCIGYIDQLTQPICTVYSDKLARPVCTAYSDQLVHGPVCTEYSDQLVLTVCTGYSDQLVWPSLYRVQWLAGLAQSVQDTVISWFGPFCTEYSDQLTRPSLYRIQWQSRNNSTCTVYCVHTISRLKLSCVVNTTLFCITKCWYFFVLKHKLNL